jgi:hypothetical protein
VTRNPEGQSKRGTSCVVPSQGAFVEGDGSFFVRFRGVNAISLYFDITQSDIDVALLEAIQNYLNDLSVAKGLVNSKSYQQGNSLSLIAKNKWSSLSGQSLRISHTLYIKNILIPFFDPWKASALRKERYLLSLAKPGGETSLETL